MTPIAYRIGIAGGFVHSKCWSAFEQDELHKTNRRPVMGDLFGTGAEELVDQKCAWCKSLIDSPWLLRTTSESGIHSYYKHTGEANGRRYIVLGGLADARLFPTDAAAATTRRTWEDHIRLSLPDSKPEDPLPLVIEMLRLTDIPECPIFAESYPFDDDHIPEQDRDIEVRWRDGRRCGVVTNFLRNEMLAGRWLLQHDLRARWRYIETRAKLPEAAAEPEDEWQHHTEDIFGDFGFRLVWRFKEHWCDVKAYEFVTRAADGTPGFQRLNSMSSPDPVATIEEAESYLEGHVKWDGCSELNQGQPHWCGPRDFVKHCRLLQHIYTKANELMRRDPPEDGTWEEAVASIDAEISEAEKNNPPLC